MWNYKDSMQSYVGCIYKECLILTSGVFNETFFNVEREFSHSIMNKNNFLIIKQCETYFFLRT